MSVTARQTAFSALMRVETAQSYSNITLDSELEKSGSSPRDRSFAAKLFDRSKSFRSKHIYTILNENRCTCTGSEFFFWFGFAVELVDKAFTAFCTAVPKMPSI